MGKFRKKPVVIEAITFDELVKLGIANGGNVVDGLPWSFKYKGYPLTHDCQTGEDRYIIPTMEGDMSMTRSDMLITGVQGEIYPCKIDIFNKTYDETDSKDYPVEYGWLIEGEEKGRAVWLCIVGGHIIWSVDSNLAVRFSRVEDGAAMARLLCKDLPSNTIGGLKITDHIWSDK